MGLLNMISIIKTDEEFERALQKLHELLDRAPEMGSKEGDEIELLTLLLSDYEERTADPIDELSPVDAIRFRMEQLDLKQQDLVPYLGAASRVSEILSGKRSLTVPMIRALHEGLGIPLKALLGLGAQSSTSRSSASL
jgi:HTH-type transcriptional regulator / antitoxin HigA